MMYILVVGVTGLLTMAFADAFYTKQLIEMANDNMNDSMKDHRDMANTLKEYEDKFKELKGQLEEQLEGHSFRGATEIIEGKNERLRKIEQILIDQRDRTEQYRDKGAELTLRLQENMQEVERLSKLVDLQRNEIKRLQKIEDKAKCKLKEYEKQVV